MPLSPPIVGVQLTQLFNEPPKTLQVAKPVKAPNKCNLTTTTPIHTRMSMATMSTMVRTPHPTHFKWKISFALHVALPCLAMPCHAFALPCLDKRTSAIKSKGLFLSYTPLPAPIYFTFYLLLPFCLSSFALTSHPNI